MGCQNHLTSSRGLGMVKTVAGAPSWWRQTATHLLPYVGMWERCGRPPSSDSGLTTSPPWPLIGGANHLQVTTRNATHADTIENHWHRARQSLPPSANAIENHCQYQYWRQQQIVRFWPLSNDHIEEPPTPKLPGVCIRTTITNIWNPWVGRENAPRRSEKCNQPCTISTTRRRCHVRRTDDNDVNSHMMF